MSNKAVGREQILLDPLLSPSSPVAVLFIHLQTFILAVVPSQKNFSTAILSGILRQPFMYSDGPKYVS